MRYAAKKKATSTAVHTVPVLKTPEEIKERRALVARRRSAAKKRAQTSCFVYQTTIIMCCFLPTESDCMIDN